MDLLVMYGLSVQTVKISPAHILFCLFSKSICPTFKDALTILTQTHAVLSSNGKGSSAYASGRLYVQHKGLQFNYIP